jgi:hypothetical protein
MQTAAQIDSSKVPHQRGTTRITTTLHDLIEAIHEEVPSGQERLVTAVIAHLLDLGRIQFIGNPHSLEIDLS